MIFCFRISAECKGLDTNIGCGIGFSNTIEKPAMYTGTLIESVINKADTTVQTDEFANTYQAVEIKCLSPQKSLPSPKISAENLYDSLPSLSDTKQCISPIDEPKNEETIIESVILPEPSTSDSIMPVINVIRPLGDIVLPLEKPDVIAPVDEPESTHDTSDLQLNISEDFDSMQNANIENKTEADSDIFMENVGVNITPGCVAPGKLNMNLIKIMSITFTIFIVYCDSSNPCSNFSSIG